jgi:hypothetical protein
MVATEKKSHSKTVQGIKEDDLKRIVREAISAELREIVREELAAAFSPVAGEAYGGAPRAEPAPSYAGPADYSVRPSNIAGDIWRGTKRVAKTAAGLGTLPVTGLYSMATQDASAAGWSAHQIADGVGGSGTWNRMQGAVQNTYTPQTRNAYVNGIFAGWDKWCGRCGTYLGRFPMPANSGYCQCGAYNMG